MDYAVISFKGHQYQVQSNQELVVDRLDIEKGKEFNIDNVLLIKKDDKVVLGEPTINNANVIAEVLEHFKGDKIRVTKFKPKTRYRRVKGFRPYLTKIKIIKLKQSKNGKN